MKAFVWQYVGNLTSSYHNGGSVLVIAADLAAARALIEGEVPPKDYDDEPLRCDALDEEPTATYDLVGVVEPEVWIFSDSGCC